MDYNVCKMLYKRRSLEWRRNWKEYKFGHPSSNLTPRRFDLSCIKW